MGYPGSNMDRPMQGKNPTCTIYLALRVVFFQCDQIYQRIGPSLVDQLLGEREETKVSVLMLISLLCILSKLLTSGPHAPYF